ncbi:MAG: Cys-Gln thioester bond-forming surface protein [Clostridia bacterium]|nr:Cys-Gln thioester bond-forming surface protein [Clostridia bacterium]
MKIAIKTIAIILMISLIILTDVMIVNNSVQAVSVGTVTVYNRGYCEKVLIYSGKPLGATYVEYEKDGVKNPAYCLDPDLPGVGEGDEELDNYDVIEEGRIHDVKLWRILINGYPYKTVDELGVASEEEAYLATKQAVYYYLKGRDYSKYSANSEAGNRVLNAFRQIVTAAEASDEVQISQYSEIVSEQINWEQDVNDKNYVSKTYQIKSIATIKDYTISLSGEHIPEGIKITDIDNNQRDVFENYEKFKILIPINNINNNGEFQINLRTEELTKPILCAKSENENLQRYALTIYQFEEKDSSYFENYGENKTKIKILKQDKTTKFPLQGTEFELLNEKKEIVYSNLITDINGEIIIDKLLPGKYYLKETRAIDGYINYDELIEINIELNETINIIVNNSKENKLEISNKETEIEVSNEKVKLNIEQEKTIKRLPITGM